jgi:hypothetical protein
MATEERVLGPMGDTILFENDRVRIWELELPPGGDSNVHEHELDYVLVQLGGIEIARNVGTVPYREIIIELKD